MGIRLPFLLVLWLLVCGLFDAVHGTFSEEEETPPVAERFDDSRWEHVTLKACGDNSCPHGRCLFVDCDNGPSCVGGLCKFVRCQSPTCEGGLCLFQECHGPRCKGGSCTAEPEARTDRTG